MGSAGALRNGAERGAGGIRLRSGTRNPWRDRKRGVVLEAAPTSAVIMAKADLLLGFLIISSNAPSQFGLIDVGEFDVIKARSRASTWSATSLSGHSITKREVSGTLEPLRQKETGAHRLPLAVGMRLLPCFPDFRE